MCFFNEKYPVTNCHRAKIITFAENTSGMHEETVKVIDENRQGEAFQLDKPGKKNNGKKLFLESYGCQMNFSDSEIIASILIDEGYSITNHLVEADVIFV